MNNHTTPPHQPPQKKNQTHSDSSQRQPGHDSMDPSDTTAKLDQKTRIVHNPSKHQNDSSSIKRADTSQHHHEDDSEGSSGTSTDAGLEALLAYEQSKHQDDSSLAKRSDSPYIQLKEELKRSMENQTFGGVLDNDGNRLTPEEAEALLAKELPEFYSLIERDLMYTQADAFIRNHTKLANQTSDSASTDSLADDYNIDNDQPTGPKFTPKR